MVSLKNTICRSSLFSYKNQKIHIKGKGNVYCIYSILFFVIGLIILLPFLLRGNGLICSVDAFDQYYPTFVFTGEYLRDLLCNKVTQFDFRIGLGDDVISTLSYYGFGDPFSIISAFSPANKSELTYEFTMLLKFYLCGISYLIYIRRHIHDKYLQVSGALIYVFSTFTLAYGSIFIMFINPMITLPLIIYGIEEILDGKKTSLALISAVCLQALTGFYFLYMEIIITVVYFLVLCIVRIQSKKFTVIESVKKGIVILVQGLLGVLCGSIIFLPSIVGYLACTRIGEYKKQASIFKLLLYDGEWYLRQASELLIPNAYHTKYTILPIVFLGILVLLFQKKTTRKEMKCMVIILVIGVLTPLTGTIMNGFSYSTDRWYFAVLFFVVTATLMLLHDKIKIKLKTILLYIILCITFIITNLILNEKTMGVLFRSIVIMGMCVVLPFLWNKQKYRNIVLLTYVTCTLALYGLFTFGPKKLGGDGYSAIFMGKGRTYSTIMSSVENVDFSGDSEFQRLDIHPASVSSSIVLDYYGTSEFFSILNSNVSEFYRKMYISPGTQSVTWKLSGLDSRVELEALLSVMQYENTAFNSEGIRQNGSIQKNNYFLPMGFVYDYCMDRSQFEMLNPLEKESAIMNFAILEEACPDMQQERSKSSDNNAIIPFKTEMIGMQGNISEFTSRDPGIIRMHFNLDSCLPEGTEVYVNLHDFRLLDTGPCNVFIGNKKIELRNVEDDYYSGIDDYWVNVTDIMHDEQGDFIDITFTDEKMYSLQSLELYSHIPNYEGIENRAKKTLRNLKIEENQLSGEIDTTSSELLFLSIPYSQGWKAYVDGISVPIYKTNIGFMGIIPKAGHHIIELKYNTPGLILGKWLSIIGIMMATALITLQKGKNISNL